MANSLAGYILTYVNPDTDGVCTSIAYSFLLEKTSGKILKPLVFGVIDQETRFVLESIGVQYPEIAQSIGPELPIILVDTHHKNQLPNPFPFEQVTEIIDHHPAGDKNLFPNAQIQNEEVGAAATLVAERYRSHGIIPESKIAGLLSAAIVSNTLNFTAPSTSKRDHAAYDWLQNVFRIDDPFVLQMFKNRSDLQAHTTITILESNIKEFTIGKLRIGISQVETTDPDQIITRSDLVDSMLSLKNSLCIDHILINAVDIVRQRSIVVAVESKTRDLLGESIGATFRDNFAQFNRILLRKTDFVPLLKSYLERL